METKILWQQQSSRLCFTGDVALVEAAAVKWGIQAAIDAGSTPLTIETDCKDVVDLVLQKKSSNTEICWIIEEIQSEMQREGNLLKIRTAYSKR